MSSLAPSAAELATGSSVGSAPAASDIPKIVSGSTTTVITASSSPKITTSSFSGGPPASPSDGDLWFATGVDGNGTRWAFQYNASSASSYKWEFVGGAPYNSVNTVTGVGTVGAMIWTVSMARQGDYHAWFDTYLFNSVGATYIQAQIVRDSLTSSYSSTSPLFKATWYQSTAEYFAIQGRLTGVTSTIGVMGNGNAGSTNFDNMNFSIVPIRVA